jgi:hypothetical protein
MLTSQFLAPLSNPATEIDTFNFNAQGPGKQWQSTESQGQIPCMSICNYGNFLQGRASAQQYKNLADAPPLAFWMHSD